LCECHNQKRVDYYSHDSDDACKNSSHASNGDILPIANGHHGDEGEPGAFVVFLKPMEGGEIVCVEVIEVAFCNSKAEAEYEHRECEEDYSGNQWILVLQTFDAEEDIVIEAIISA
jgi:hypothetical protein